MVRRLVQVVALAVAVAVAVAAGTYVRHQRTGPDPVETAEAATAAYAAGDCKGLRAVSFDPSLVDCAEVAGVRDAYRAEGLEPDTFRYDVVSREGAQAAVRITYRRDDQRAEEIVRLQRRGDDWLVLAAPVGQS